MLELQLDSLDGLDDGVKSLYKEVDGKFSLNVKLPANNDVENEKRITDMDAKITELLGEKKLEAKKRKEAETLAAKEIEEAARKSGDTQALDESWKAKYAQQETDLRAEFEPKITEQNNLLHKATVMTEATRIAAEIAIPGSAKALMPHIISRLDMEVRDGQAVTVVRGADGKPSALTIAELQNEFTSDKAFAPLIVGSNASGGGADSSNNGGGAVNTDGKLTGSKAERTASLKARFPDLT